MSELITPAYTVPVNLGTRSYRVDVGHGLLQNLGSIAHQLLTKSSTCAVITDSNVGPLYAETALESLKAVGKNGITKNKTVISWDRLTPMTHAPA